MTHSVGAFLHLVIPEPENPKALSLEMPIADNISLQIRVLAAIHLNDQPNLKTDKVEDVAFKRLLAA